MAGTDVILRLDDALLARAEAAGSDLSATVDAALRLYLDRRTERQVAELRWAEDNALSVEALAGGAEEAAER